MSMNSQDHADLAKAGIAPIRPLSDDLEVSDPVLKPNL